MWRITPRGHALHTQLQLDRALATQSMCCSQRRCMFECLWSTWQRPRGGSPSLLKRLWACKRGQHGRWRREEGKGTVISVGFNGLRSECVHARDWRVMAVSKAVLHVWPRRCNCKDCPFALPVSMACYTCIQSAVLRQEALHNGKSEQGT